VLRYKYVFGLANYTPIKTKNLIEDLNATEYDALNRKLNSEAMTLLRNSQNLIPITHLNKGRIAVVSVGNDTESVFQKTITLYADNIGRFDDSNPLPSLLDTLKHYDKIILAVHSGKAEHRARIGRICQTGKAIVACFLSPYQMNRLSHELTHCKTLLLAYENTPLAQEYAAQALFGGYAIKVRSNWKKAYIFQSADWDMRFPNRSTWTAGYCLLSIPL